MLDTVDIEFSPSKDTRKQNIHNSLQEASIRNRMKNDESSTLTNDDIQFLIKKADSQDKNLFNRNQRYDYMDQRRKENFETAPSMLNGGQDSLWRKDDENIFDEAVKHITEEQASQVAKEMSQSLVSGETHTTKYLHFAIQLAKKADDNSKKEIAQNLFNVMVSQDETIKTVIDSGEISELFSSGDLRFIIFNAQQVSESQIKTLIERVSEELGSKSTYDRLQTWTNEPQVANRDKWQEKIKEKQNELLEIKKSREDGPEYIAQTVSEEVFNRLLGNENYNLSVEEAKAIMWKWVEVGMKERRERQSINGGYYSMDTRPLNPLTNTIRWDEIAEKGRHSGYSQQIIDETIKRLNPTGFEDFDTRGQELMIYVKNGLTALSEEKRVELSKWMLDVLPVCQQEIGDIYDLFTYTEIALGKTATLSPQSRQEIGEATIRYMQEVLKDDSLREVWGWDMIGEVTHYGFEKNIMIALASMPDIPERHLLVSQMLRTQNLPHILNVVREMINEEEFQDKAKEFLLFLYGDPSHSPSFEGKAGVKKKAVDASISEFYENLKFIDDESETGFESYPISQEAARTRPPIYENILREQGIASQDVVVDAASGEGWLTHALRERGFNAIGFDVVDNIVAVASAKYGAHFKKGDVYHVKETVEAENKKAKAILLEGMTSRHFETESNLLYFLQNASDALEDNGVIIMDAPDPTKGRQGEKIEDYRKFLEGFGYSKEWLDRYMWNMVSSPLWQKGDTERFIHSMALPYDLLKDLAGSRGLAVMIGHTQENYDGHGSVRHTYVCKKTTGEERKQLIETSSKNIRERIKTQPKNPNGAELSVWSYTESAEAPEVLAA